MADGVRRWGLRYVVLTQVCLDDLSDGGASVLAESVREIRRASPSTLVELLVGDFQGKAGSLKEILEVPPDVLAHNIETVERLTPMARDRRAAYHQSLELLRRARAWGPAGIVTKSSIMLGLGEEPEELSTVFDDLRAVGVDLLTLGQYLRPTERHLPVHDFVPPDGFLRWKRIALERGFAGVEAGPLVRSSYHAEELFRAAMGLREA